MVSSSVKLILVALLAILSLGGWLILEWPRPGVHFITCDIGQGDAILITQGFSQVLIDAGPDDKVLACLQQYLPFWDRQLELVVMTHPDQDHIGGFPSVLSRYQAKNILLRPLGKPTQTFQKVVEALTWQRQQGARIRLASFGDVFEVGEVRFEVWHPLELNKPEIRILSLPTPQSNEPVGASSPNKPPENELWDEFLHQLSTTEGENNDSIVLFAQHKNVTWLLTGDLERPGELALSQARVLRPINILKIGHHGAKTSSTKDFLQQLRPEFAVISCGKNNRYGHPAKEVVENLNEMGIKFKRTDEEGHIHIVSNGLTWQLY